MHDILAKIKDSFYAKAPATEVGTNCKKTIITSTRRQFAGKTLDKCTNMLYLCQDYKNTNDFVS